MPRSSIYSDKTFPFLKDHSSVHYNHLGNGINEKYKVNCKELNDYRGSYRPSGPIPQQKKLKCTTKGRKQFSKKKDPLSNVHMYLVKLFNAQMSELKMEKMDDMSW